MFTQNSPVDAVSDVLELARLRAEWMYLSALGAPWGLRFSAGPSHFHIVRKGCLWLEVDGNDTRIEAHDGDLVLVPRGLPHTIRNAPGQTAIPIGDLPSHAFKRETATLTWGGDGDQTLLLTARFGFVGVIAQRLLNVLPAVIHVRMTDAPGPNWLAGTAYFLTEEIVNPKPGSAVMLSRLIDLVFVQALRAWASTHGNGLSWLGGLADPRIGRVLSAIHAEPARAWTSQALSEIAGQSRSAFAARFRQVVGEPPLTYLSHWRMNLAADLLRSGSRSIGEVARQVGYASDASFSKAFKAHHDAAPSALRTDPHMP